MALKIQNAMARVRQIISTEKNPQLASSVDHTYEDKYLLAEFLVNMTLASEITSLCSLGLAGAQLDTLKAWQAEGRTVTLRFHADEACTFLRSETRREDSGEARVTEGSLFGTITSKVVTTVKEYFWKFEASWEVLVFRGTGESPDDLLRIAGRKGDFTMKTTTEMPPRSAGTGLAPVDSLNALT